MINSETKRYIEKVLLFDKRSLALFRICLGSIILFDLWITIQDLDIFYGVDALLSLDQFSHKVLMIHDWVNSNTWIYVLHIMIAISTVCYVVGFYPKISGWLTFLLLTSFHLRFPYGLDSSDRILRLFLLFSVFLPINDFFSIKKNESSSISHKGYVSGWTLVYIIQLSIIYAVAGFVKMNEVWNSGYGVFYVLNKMTYARPAAQYLLEYPFLYKSLNYMTLVIEKTGWLLFFLPSNGNRNITRAIMVVLFMSLHLGFLVFMGIGKFPLVGVVIWIPLIPGFVWDRKPFTIESKDLILWFWSLKGFNSRTVLTYLSVIFLFLMVYGTLTKYKITPVIQLVKRFESETGMYQSWSMFRKPNNKTGWFALQGITVKGDTLDLYRKKTYSETPPENLNAEFKNHNQRVFFRAIRTKKKLFNAKRYTHWEVNKWNKEHSQEDRVIEAHLYDFVHTVSKTGEISKPDKKKIYTYKVKR